MTVAFLGLAVVLAQVLGGRERRKGDVQVERAELAIPTISISGPNQLHIPLDLPLKKRLREQVVEKVNARVPQLRVSGSVIARIKKGSDAIEDRWQFSSADVSTIYTDWRRAQHELEFQIQQLKKTKELATAETDFLQQTVYRLEPLFRDGGVPEKDFRAAQSAMLKARISTEKDIFAAETLVRSDRRELASLGRDLAQNGLDPVVFSRAVEGMVLVAAEVPEMKIAEVHEGQGCEVRFYGLGEQTFPAHVEVLAATLRSDRRTLRVLFDLNDTEEDLKPGMFGEVALGTDPRPLVMVPETALLRIGQRDYVLVADNQTDWRAVAVKAGEGLNGQSPVHAGLQGGETVLVEGCILLKRQITQALQTSAGSAPQ